MEHIRVISASTILPATYAPESTPQRIHLTPWDLQFLLLGPIQKGILFASSPPDLVDRLKSSLSRALDHFYPLAGRLSFAEDASTDSKLYFIECDNRGVEFIHAAARSATVADLLECEYHSGLIKALFSQNELLNNECGAKPFFSAQVTQLADGGCFIGCTLSHSFGDGTSFWHFLYSWSEISRGCGRVSNEPVLDRQYPHRSEVWIPNALLVKKFGKFEDPTVFKEMMFHFSKEKIACLKSKAIKETKNPKISSLQALLAHVWRASTRSRGVDAEAEVHFTMGIGDRARAEPPLPTHYLGNSIRLAKVTLIAAEIMAEGGLGRAACELNKLVASQTGSVVSNFISSWNENPALLVPNGVSVGGKSLVTSSSPKFDVYGNDFGWGRPVGVRSGGGNKVDGKLTMFAGADDGSIDIEVCFRAETLERLVRDDEFKLADV